MPKKDTRIATPAEVNRVAKEVQKRMDKFTKGLGKPRVKF